MRVISSSWSLMGGLVANTLLHSFCATASPSINVGLRASFHSAPYLLELLETAAEENATSYYPLLDRIADGYFSKAVTEKELYEQFLQVLEADGHLNEAETLSSYKFALSMRSAAPRIEAHYQYYHTAAEPSLNKEESTSCPVWVLFDGRQYCSPALDEVHGEIEGNNQMQELPFDRIMGPASAPGSVLYADITSPNFGEFHKTLVKTAREGKTSYRIRHRRSLTSKNKPLAVPGYGVELALKRTDYIVIDDRADEESVTSALETSEKEVKFEDEEFADLKPLSSSEVLSLAVKASSFIMQSEKPLDTLVKLSQDFPKYSSAIASHNATIEFIAEHEHNRAELVPAGYNVIWMNGVQMTERQIEALDLLEILRKERALINGVRDLGLTAPEAIALLGHSEISKVRVGNDVQRYDWRDDLEGGNIILWMNDIEKDKRYEDWPTNLASMLQRTYPGQLPTTRRDIFNLVLPVDFTDASDLQIITETLLSFVKRKLAIRIGLVPLTKTAKASDQARVVYYLVETYGLQTALTYLETSLQSKTFSMPSKSTLESAVEDRRPKINKVSLQFEGILKSDSYHNQVEAAKKWIRRLGADSNVPPLFVDGAAILRDENWLQSMSTKVTADLQTLQQAVFMDTFEESSWLPSYFLDNAATRRNSLIVPEDEKLIKIFDVNKLAGEHQATLAVLPRITADQSTPKSDWASMILVADLETEAGAKLLGTAVATRDINPSIELSIVHNPTTSTKSHGASINLFTYLNDNAYGAFSNVDDLTAILGNNTAHEADTLTKAAFDYWQKSTPFVKALNLAVGQNAILLSGRLVGPIPHDTDFDLEDMASLLSYERTKRISPAYAAMEALQLTEKLQDPFGAAKVSSIIALSQISDTPSGIFEEASTLRMTEPETWKASSTVIETGDKQIANIQFLVLIDPASTQGQRWIPLLKVLSELDGLYMKIYLNPKERLTELPVKRFYRYVLDSAPTFDEHGAVKPLGASFGGVPQEALLTLGLDIPPAWLVAPKVSVHDLDNIKLSATKTDVEAIYELENILIEGHSREIPSSAAPRGAQLVLGTERNSHAGDTIIMANLGYFQFKANPGFYKIALQHGRSSDIFNIDSIGSKGWTPVPGDENTDVVLMSFRGTTLYPRLSRKDGMDSEDVLESDGDTFNAASDLLSRGLNFAQGILSGKPKTAVAKSTAQADINIFSVASGHLYERMLNIMMVSVMKHTNHTVKFWFIEQFLSPSFKDFIPYLAAEYGFEYEMVTYKWPHWLRAQTEKQREIWGYKILFLDVLFPLSLDKVIFVDADQIVRTDMIELVNHDLKGAPYGFTPMCDSRTEMEGFRFWKQGYWEKFLRGLPYHISALYVVDLKHFRQIAAGDRLRQQYHSLSADPNSLSNLDQDLPNHMQTVLPIHSLPQEWLWCETWCSDESQKDAKTIDLCNNPQTKEPKLDRARRQVPEWTVYDDEIAAVDRKRRGLKNGEKNPKSRTLEVKPASSTTSEKDEL